MQPGSLSQFHVQNQKAWDRMAEKQSRFAKAAEDKEFINPLATVDGKLGWLAGGVQGKELLCLAAGGGRQSALYAAAGANVTVVDISPNMLRLDREVATERKLNIRTCEASMDDLSMFDAGRFEVVVHPVSTCYIPNIQKVYHEVARICRPGAIYISQHKTPTSLQSDLEGRRDCYLLRERYYRGASDALPEIQDKSRLREPGTVEFIHRWEEIVGGMCRAGFVIEDLIEPNHAKPGADPGSFGHRGQFIAPYVRIKARRVGEAAAGPFESSDNNCAEDPQSSDKSRIWLPETE